MGEEGLGPEYQKVLDETFGKLSLPVERHKFAMRLTSWVQRSLSKLFGWDTQDELWRPVTVDSDGYLLASHRVDQYNTLDYNQVTVGATATQIVDADTSRKILRVINRGGAEMFIGGDSSVLTSTGYSLTQNKEINMDGFTGALYGIVASGTTTACALEGTNV